MRPIAIPFLACAACVCLAALPACSGSAAPANTPASPAPTPPLPAPTLLIPTRVPPPAVAATPAMTIITGVASSASTVTLSDLGRLTATPPPTPQAVGGVITVTLPYPRPVDLRLNQTLMVVVPPKAPFGWDVEYDKTRLELVAFQSDAAGGGTWRFKPLRVGETAVAFVSHMPECRAGAPCPKFPTFTESLTVRIAP